jgi:teichuronic acid biosynthesis glycosyltransferase TuaG
MKKPSISIITPCYNSQNYLSKMISSVILQTYTNWQLIIVDDCSKDDSVKVIEKFLKLDHRIKLIKLKKNKGQAFARNKAINVAEGRYITFLDSDDYWKGTPISCLSAFIDTKKFGKIFFPLEFNREDLAYWVLLLKDFKFAYGCNFCEANYRLHQKSSSKNKIKMAYFTWQDYKDKYNLSLFKGIYYFIHYAGRGCLKFLKQIFLKILYFLLFIKTR